MNLVVSGLFRRHRKEIKGCASGPGLTICHRCKIDPRGCGISGKYDYL